MLEEGGGGHVRGRWGGMLEKERGGHVREREGGAC